MWFSVVSSLIENDTRHYSGQNVVDSRGAAKCIRNKLSYITKRALCFSYVIKINVLLAVHMGSSRCI